MRLLAPCLLYLSLSGVSALSAAAQPRPTPAPDAAAKLDRALYYRFTSYANPMNPAWLKALTGSPSVELRTWVARHPFTPEASVLAMVQSLPQDYPGWALPELEIQKAAAQREKPSQALFDALLKVKDLNNQTRDGLSGNETLDTALLVSLTRTGGLRVRMNLARNPSTPPELLKALAASGSSYVSQQLEGNPACGPEVFALLLASSDAASRMSALASAPSLTLAQLETALADMDPAVLAYVANRDDLPREAYERLAAVKDQKVQERLAQNEVAPAALIDEGLVAFDFAKEQLAKAKAEHKEAAAYVSATAVGGDRKVLDTLSRDRLLSAADFQALAQLPGGPLDHLLAKNPTAPDELLRALARSGRWDVRVAVARNQRCPREILFELAKDPELSVREAVLARRVLSVEDTIPLLEGAPTSQLWIETLNYWDSAALRLAAVKHAKPEIRRAAYQRIACRAGCAEGILDEADPSLRQLAFGKTWTWAQWQRLAKDPDAAIAKQAQAAIKQAREDYKVVAGMR